MPRNARCAESVKKPVPRVPSTLSIFLLANPKLRNQQFRVLRILRILRIFRILRIKMLNPQS
jgi:hypothetical protein